MVEYNLYNSVNINRKNDQEQVLSLNGYDAQPTIVRGCHGIKSPSSSMKATIYKRKGGNNTVGIKVMNLITCQSSYYLRKLSVVIIIAIIWPRTGPREYP